MRSSRRDCGLSYHSRRRGNRRRLLDLHAQRLDLAIALLEAIALYYVDDGTRSIRSPWSRMALVSLVDRFNCLCGHGGVVRW